MLKKIKNKHVAFITAHPDDESVLAAGTLIIHKASGGKTSLFCATVGEQGSGYIQKSIDQKELSIIRKKELKAAAQYFGINKVVASNFPDSKIHQHKVRLKKEVMKFVLKTKPDILISFGLDGYTGHTDHITVGRVAKIVAQKMKVEFLEFARPPLDQCADLGKYLKKKRKNGLYLKKVSNKRGAVLSIKVDPKTKIEALRLYKTQFMGINPYNIFPKKIAEHLLSREYYSVVKKYT
jgi:LmbE family N-acetylglucosaminyl deacetylase